MRMQFSRVAVVGRVGVVGVVGLVSLLTLGVRNVRAETLGDGWPYRRPVTFKQVASDAPGGNIAWAEFYTNGKQKPDAADIRVTTADRIIVPHRLMQVSRDSDAVRLAFATRGDGPYFVWWGNPKAEKPLQDLEIHRGIFLELSRPTRASATTPAVAGPQLLTSFLLPNLGLAYNPLGDPRQVTYHYAATFKIDSPLTAQILLALSGTGTLEIDGKAIPMKPIGRPVPVSLAAGWHALDIRQVNANPTSPSINLSWQRPGDKTLKPFPLTLFAPAASASAGNLQNADGSLRADIAPDPAAEVVLAPGAYAQRYTFETSFAESLRPAIAWSFGDGQTATALRKVNHIFLTPGVYPVTVKLQPAGGKAQETTVRVAIGERMIERMPRPPVDAAATVRAILKDYDLERLPAEDAFRGLQFFESAKDDDLQITWGRAWLAGRETRALPSDEVVSREAFAVAGLQLKKKLFGAAAEALKLAAAKPIGMDSRINLVRHEIMILCNDANDATAALQEARAWATGIVPTNPVQVRTAQVALAYALIAIGDGKNAQAAVDAAMAPPATGPAKRGAAPSPAPGPEPDATWRAKIEDALGKKDLDGAAAFLDQWELADPHALWTGASRLLRVKLLAAEGRPLDAARIAAQHARANPEGPNAAELLFHAVENDKLGGDLQQAAAALDLLRKNYPSSPFAREAQPK